jgi:predicted peptidase
VTVETGVFLAREYKTPQGQVMAYRLYLPEGYDSSEKYPLVVFLHGAGGRGIDNKGQMNGSGSVGTRLWSSAEVQQRHPTLVLAPQANPRPGTTWVHRWRPSENPDPADKEPLQLVMEIIDQLQGEFSIDSERLYVTGLSMGGFGAWSAVSRFPDKFAAAVPICGGGDPSMLENVTVPVWAFHGAADTLVPPRRSREMIEALRKAGAEPRYTEYPGIGHNSWELAYQEPDLAPWLFSQRRQQENQGGQPGEPVGLSSIEKTRTEAPQ